MNKLKLHSEIMNIEALMAKEPQVDLLVKHTFSNAIYARELLIPKGVMITGRVHKYETLNIMVSGKMKVLSDQGGYTILEGYNIMTAPAKLKRIGIALEDTIWITFHVTKETDPDKIVELITIDDENTEAIKNTRKLT